MRDGRRSSLAWRLALIAFALVAIGVTTALALQSWLGDPMLSGAATLLVLLPLTLYAITPADVARARDVPRARRNGDELSRR